MSLPPVHPALVHLPIAFVVLLFAVDLIGKLTGRESLRLMGFWSILAALLSGVATIAAGYWDLNRLALTPEMREIVDMHITVGWTLAAALVVLAIWRWRIRQQARRVVTAPYLAASLVVFSMTMFQGWYGGEMVYSHGAGVAAAGQGTEPTTTGRQRLARVRQALGADTAVGGPSQSRQGETGQKSDR